MTTVSYERLLNAWLLSYYDETSEIFCADSRQVNRSAELCLSVSRSSLANLPSSRRLELILLFISHNSRVVLIQGTSTCFVLYLM